MKCRELKYLLRELPSGANADGLGDPAIGIDSAEHAEDKAGGLAGAVGAGQDEGRAVVDAEVDVAEHRLRVPHARDVVEEEPRRRGAERRHPAEWPAARRGRDGWRRDGRARRGEVGGPLVEAAAMVGGTRRRPAGGARRGTTPRARWVTE